MKLKDWKYRGDMNLECGGLFWRRDSVSDDFVEAVEVVDLSSAVGGPDCIWLIEAGSIYLPEDTEKRRAALATCGYDLVEVDGETMLRDGTGKSFPIQSDEAFEMLVDAFHGYQGIETNSRSTVQIGKLTDYDPDPVPGFEPDTFLRGNAKLARYIERAYL